MTIYGYSRVSTSEQAEEYSALEQQQQRLRDAGAEIILTDIESGRDDNREKFNEILRLAKQGKIRELIVTRIDRLGRNTITLGQTYKLLEENNVKLRILDAPIDANSLHGWFSLHTLSGMAEFESRMLSQRTNHGLNYFREQKKVAQKLFGYKNINHKLVIDEGIFPIARGIIDRLLQGYSYGTVSRWLFEEHDIKFSLSGLRHWIDNPAIQGHTRYFSEVEHRRNPKNPRPPLIHFNTHKALASAEEISKIKNIVKSTRKLSEKQNKNYPLKGLLRCAQCDGGMYRTISRFKSGVTEYVRCTKHSQGNHFCSNKVTARSTKITDQLIKLLIKQAQQILSEVENNAVEKINSEYLLSLQRELTGLESLQSKNPAILAAINDLRTQIVAEENRLQKPALLPDKERIKMLTSFAQATFWESLDEDKLSLSFRTFVESASIDSAGNIFSVKFLS
ncbi:MAG: recombinase family protein [Methylacidiphilales bacterium]|nr:recombinase family protein [Candidatus Methylacidiphilales bacterium]NJR19491.1 recombinase family protein [Calothrix sp. CSU_2_0]